ncbi:MAG: hypothetical protein ACR2NU_07870, partial [Aeoliella sp.]
MPADRKWSALWLLVLLTSGIYFAVTLNGPEYGLDIPKAKRPILLVLGLFAAAFLLYLAALSLAVRMQSTKRLSWWIVGTSLAFRALLLPSPPFMEIDLYRYAWDGVVSAQGESPFRYSPLQVRLAASKLEFDMPVGDPELEKLARFAESDAGIAKVLNTVHYAELRTVYPPVSQVVFYATACCTPAGVSAEWRVLLIKLAMMLFDLATLVIVMLLLSLAGKPIGWAVAYGWCPLVLKEFTNSGHLDTIAVALSMAAIGAAVVGWQRAGHRDAWALASSGLLALAVGAKLYPIVLTPLFILTWWRRGSWRLAVAASGVLLVGSYLCLQPMYSYEPPLKPA